MLEVQAFLLAFVDRGCPVIPVILPDYPKDEKPKLPPFLALFTWVDFRREAPDPFEQLTWGITGRKGGGGWVPSPAGVRRKARWPWWKRISASLAATGLAGTLATLATWWWPRIVDSPAAAVNALQVLHGEVLDASGSPLAGALVEVPEHSLTTTTGERGGFSLELPVEPNAKVRLRISMAGFESMDEDPMVGTQQFQRYRMGEKNDPDQDPKSDGSSTDTNDHGEFRLSLPLRARRGSWPIPSGSRT